MKHLFRKLLAIGIAATFLATMSASVLADDRREIEEPSTNDKGVESAWTNDAPEEVIGVSSDSREPQGVTYVPNLPSNWLFTAPSSGYYSITTSSAGTPNADTQIVVEIASNGSMIAANDDYYTNHLFACCYNLYLTGGTQYRIKLKEYNGTNYAVNLNIESGYKSVPPQSTAADPSFGGSGTTPPPTGTPTYQYSMSVGDSLAMNVDSTKRIKFRPSITAWYYVVVQHHYNAAGTGGSGSARILNSSGNLAPSHATESFDSTTNKYMNARAYLTANQDYFIEVSGRYDVMVTIYDSATTGSGKLNGTWVSSSTSVGYIPRSSIYVRNVYDTSPSSMNISNFLTTAISRWSGVTNSVYTTTSDNYNIGLYVGTKSTLSSRYGVSTDAAAWTRYATTYSYSTSGDKKIVEFKGVNTIYLFTNYPSGETFSTTIMQNNLTHELGHALGYLGHAPTTVSNGIMGSGELSGPSQNEKKHLAQAYGRTISSVSNDDDEFVINVQSGEPNTALKDIIGATDVIVKAKPIEIISGAEEDIGLDGDQIMPTFYKAVVSEYYAGKRTDSEIMISSQYGNLLELDKEYLLFAEDLKSPYYNMCILFSRAGIVEPGELDEDTLSKCIMAVQSKVDSRREILSFVEDGTSEADLRDFSDVVVTVEINELLPKMEGDLDNVDVKATPIMFEKGTADASCFAMLRLKDGIEVGKSYRLYLKKADDGNLDLAAATGAVVELN